MNSLATIHGSAKSIRSSSIRKAIQTSPIQTILFNLHTVWLFTSNDVSTFVVPNTLFGVLAAMSKLINNSTGVNHWDWCLQVASRIPYIIVFSWINLLIYDLANQRLPSSIEEDKLNKPFRPLPQQRLSPEAARDLLLFSIPLAWAISYALNTLHESAFIVATTWMYNDLGAGDLHYLVRNGLLSVGFALWNLGAVKIAAGVESSSQLSPMAVQWVIMISVMIFSTITIQDLKDQIGDREKGRRTAPIVLGDSATRWLIVIPIAFWMIVCPAFWRVGMMGFSMSIIPGLAIILRLLTWRDARSDDKTWKIWALWQIGVYFLPILA